MYRGFRHPTGYANTRVGTLYKQVATPDSLGYLIGFVDLQHLLMGLG